jgi:hypothetical protein
VNRSLPLYTRVVRSVRNVFMNRRTTHVLGEPRPSSGSTNRGAGRACEEVRHLGTSSLGQFRGCLQSRHFAAGPCRNCATTERKADEARRWAARHTLHYKTEA